MMVIIKLSAKFVFAMTIGSFQNHAKAGAMPEILISVTGIIKARCPEGISRED